MMLDEQVIRKQLTDMYQAIERNDVDYDYAMGYIAALLFVLGEE